MAKKTPRKKRKLNTLDAISGEDAIEVLRILANRDGYVSTGETAWQMFEAALEPFREDMLKYQQLSMLAQAEAIYLGTLKGIYDFEWYSTTEFKDWAVDAPAEFFSTCLGEWNEHFQERSSDAKLDLFLTAHCPKWAEKAT